jgi:hypothetical protein
MALLPAPLALPNASWAQLQLQPMAVLHAPLVLLNVPWAQLLP